MEFIKNILKSCPLAKDYNSNNNMQLNQPN